MKKKKWFLVITSILLMLLACTQIQAAAIKAPANIKVTASKKASVSIKWSKVSNASGYEIWRANSAKGNYSKIKTIKTKNTTSYANKKLPPLSPSYVGKYSTIINKIGGMHKKSNSGYPSFYAAGNKMIIGVNYNAKYSKNQKYVYICNRGNYGVGIGGMQLGMTLSKATAILNKNGLRSFNNPTVFWWGNAASITLTIKNNIVTGFTYACAPTCD